MESEIKVEIIEKKRFRKYKFTNKKHSVGGMISTICSLIAIIFFVVGIRIAFKAEGEAGVIVGVLGVLSFILSLYGFIKGVRSFKVEDCFYGFSWFGTICNAVLWIVVGVIIIMGI